MTQPEPSAEVIEAAAEAIWAVIWPTAMTMQEARAHPVVYDDRIGYATDAARAALTAAAQHSEPEPSPEVIEAVAKAIGAVLITRGSTEQMARAALTAAGVAAVERETLTETVIEAAWQDYRESRLGPAVAGSAYKAGVKFGATWSTEHAEGDSFDRALAALDGAEHAEEPSFDTYEYSGVPAVLSLAAARQAEAEAQDRVFLACAAFRPVNDSATRTELLDALDAYRATIETRTRLEGAEK